MIIQFILGLQWNSEYLDEWVNAKIYNIPVDIRAFCIDHFEYKLKETCVTILFGRAKLYVRNLYYFSHHHLKKIQ